MCALGTLNSGSHLSLHTLYGVSCVLTIDLLIRLSLGLYEVGGHLLSNELIEQDLNSTQIELTMLTDYCTL